MAIKIIPTNKRELSYIPKSTAFTADVWFHIIKKAPKLSFTEKKFLTSIVEQELIYDASSYITVPRIIALIKKQLEFNIGVLHGIPEPTSKNVKRQKAPSYLSDDTNGFVGTIYATHVQKFIRHDLNKILTEREIRKLTNDTRHEKFKHLYQNNKQNFSQLPATQSMYTFHLSLQDERKHNLNCPVNEESLAYYKWHYETINKIQDKMYLFYARLFKNASIAFQQYFHFSNPKHLHTIRYSDSEPTKFTYAHQCLNFYNFTTLDLFPSYKRITQVLESLHGNRNGQILFVGYDKGMLKYARYSVHLNRDHAAVQNSFISQSLHNELITACNRIVTRRPKKINESQAYIDMGIATQYFKQLSRHNCSIQHDRHFTINNRGQCTYTPAGKPTILTSNGTWLSGNGRQVTKFGKALKKLLAYKLVDIPDYVIEILQNHIKSVYTFTDRFEMVRGKDITKYYNEINYSTDPCGTLHGSCMRYSNCQTFFSIYEDNANMLVSFNQDNKVTGRALIWDVQTEGGEKILIMDRIYGNDKTISAFKGYAEQHKMYYKRHQSYENGHKFVSPKGHNVDLLVFKTINWCGTKRIAYMDTMKNAYYDKDKQKLHLSNYYSDEHYKGLPTYSLTATSGRIRGLTDNAPETYPGQINIGGVMYDEDDCRWSEDQQEWIHMDDAAWCVDIDDYVHVEDAIWLEDQEEYYTESCEDVVFNESQGQYCHVDNCTLCHDSSGNATDYYDTEDTVYCEVGGYYIHQEDSFYCEVTDQYMHYEEMETHYHSLDTEQELESVQAYANATQEDIDEYLVSNYSCYDELIENQSNEI